MILPLPGSPQPIRSDKHAARLSNWYLQGWWRRRLPFPCLTACSGPLQYSQSNFLGYKMYRFQSVITLSSKYSHVQASKDWSSKTSNVCRRRKKACFVLCRAERQPRQLCHLPGRKVYGLPASSHVLGLLWNLLFSALSRMFHERTCVYSIYILKYIFKFKLFPCLYFTIFQKLLETFEVWLRRMQISARLLAWIGEAVASTCRSINHTLTLNHHTSTFREGKRWLVILVDSLWCMTLSDMLWQNCSRKIWKNMKGISALSIPAKKSEAPDLWQQCFSRMTLASSLLMNCWHVWSTMSCV